MEIIVQYPARVIDSFLYNLFCLLTARSAFALNFSNGSVSFAMMISVCGLKVTATFLAGVHSPFGKG
jgi:hypothetical protein